MSTKLSFILFIIILLASCKPKTEPNLLLGNWYGFDQDSAYYELYISDSLIILNHENMGFAEYSYKKDGTKLITTTPLFFERVWNLDSVNDSIFILSDTLETHHYYRIDTPMDFFGSLKDSMEFAGFKEGFISRNQKHKND
ncbi:hypothetical protein [Fontibacter flavus]|uniref:Lipocalin-like domain-containing protein n=1 Tax=Fontibacter flavus TaxID=654838 RepID=A0ABV6FNM4_9BACT